jgi:transcriptional regulator of arginine metabolism
MDLKTKRKMIEVLRGTIGHGYNGTQEDLREILISKGFDVTQSTISRALRKMGAIKTAGPDGSSRYELSKQQPMSAYGGNINNLVLSTKANEAMIVLKTTPGAAMFVAGFIDHRCGDFILGTIAGDDTIFCTPVSTKKISTHLNKIKEYILNN